MGPEEVVLTIPCRASREAEFAMRPLHIGAASYLNALVPRMTARCRYRSHGDRSVLLDALEQPRQETQMLFVCYRVSRFGFRAKT